jgi:hypothetical protein
LIFHLLHFQKNAKFPKKLKRTLEKRKGKVAFHFFAFGRWDKHLGDMRECGTKVRSDWGKLASGPLPFHFSTFSSFYISF